MTCRLCSRNPLLLLDLGLLPKIGLHYTLWTGCPQIQVFIFLNLAQAFTASLIAFLYLKVQGKSTDRPSKPFVDKYMQVAFLSVIAPPFSYAVLKHIDYPTIILTKSCKLIPVMFMSILLFRRKFSPT
ncbi:UDP-galactose transporter, partial [Podila horticola]